MTGKSNPEVIGLPEWKDLVKAYDKDGDGELTHEETRPNKSILSRFDADGEGDHPLWGFHRFLDADRSGKIFASSRRGVVTVFEVGDKLKVLARNDLKERIMATPAIVDGKLYVRTEKNLYAFGLKD